MSLNTFNMFALEDRVCVFRIIVYSAFCQALCIYDEDKVNMCLKPDYVWRKGFFFLSQSWLKLCHPTLKFIDRFFTFMLFQTHTFFCGTPKKKFSIMKIIE